MNNPTLGKRFDLFKHELKGKPGILEVTSAAQRPIDVGQGVRVNWKGNPQNNSILFRYTMVDYDFFKTFNIPILQGRDFSQQQTTDKISACIINETAKKRMALKNPMGANLNFLHMGIDPSLRNLRIIGVVKDFHYRSLHSEIGPFVFRIYRPWHRFVFVKIGGSSMLRRQIFNGSLTCSVY